MIKFYLFILGWIQVIHTNSVNDTNIATPVTTIEKPIGLPKVEWNVLRIDFPSRENLCQRQIAYCANNCGGPNEVAKNFCNATSMAWGCNCIGKSTEFPNFLWPVIQAECSGKAEDCQMICNKDTVHPSACAALCNSYYQCGTDKAPTSYLQTENPSDNPSYDEPKQTTIEPIIDIKPTSNAHRFGFSFVYSIILISLSILL